MNVKSGPQQLQLSFQIEFLGVASFDKVLNEKAQCIICPK